MHRKQEAVFFPLKEAQQGCVCVFSCGGAVSRVVEDHTVLFFLGEDKALAQRHYKKNVGAFSSAVSFLC